MVGVEQLTEEGADTGAFAAAGGTGEQQVGEVTAVGDRTEPWGEGGVEVELVERAGVLGVDPEGHGEQGGEGREGKETKERSERKKEICKGKNRF